MSINLGDLFGVGASALAGGLNNRAKTETSNLPSQYAPLEGDLLSQITNMMANPTAGTAPVTAGLKDEVNAQYQGLPQRLTTQLAQRGFAQSGQLGQGLKGIELARGRDLSNVNTQMAQYGLNRQMTAMQLAEKFMASARGKTYSGNVAGGALSGGLSSLSALNTLNKMLNGGGGDSSSSGSGGSFFPGSGGGGTGSGGGSGDGSTVDLSNYYSGFTGGSTPGTTPDVTSSISYVDPYTMDPWQANGYDPFYGEGNRYYSGSDPGYASPGYGSDPNAGNSGYDWTGSD